MQERGREEKERRKEKPVTTIGVTDLRPPLFVGMRVSFVPDTLTFSRKHSCLHSCSLGRDTHYSLLLPFVSCPSTRRSLLHPLSRLPSFHCWMPYKLLRMHACTHARTHARTHAATCVHIPGETLKLPLCVQTRMRVRLEPKRWTTPSRFLSLTLSLLPFLTSAYPPPPLAASLAPLCSGAHVA